MAEVPQDCCAGFAVGDHLRFRPRAATVADGFDADTLPVGVVGLPARERATACVPGNTDTAQGDGAVTPQVNLRGQLVVQTRVAGNVARSGGVTAGVVGENALDIAEIAVTPLLPARHFYDFESPRAEQVREEKRVSPVFGVGFDHWRVLLCLLWWCGCLWWVLPPIGVQHIVHVDLHTVGAGNIVGTLVERGIPGTGLAVTPGTRHPTEAAPAAKVRDDTVLKHPVNTPRMSVPSYPLLAEHFARSSEVMHSGAVPLLEGDIKINAEVDRVPRQPNLVEFLLRCFGIRPPTCCAAHHVGITRVSRSVLPAGGDHQPCGLVSVHDGLGELLPSHPRRAGWG